MNQQAQKSTKPSPREYLSALKRLRIQRIDPGNITTILDDVKGQSDRGAAILVAALMEEMLCRAIAPYFPGVEDEDEIFGEHRMLYSFDNKITAGRALGVYGKQTAANLLIVKELRNFFAHAPATMSFESKEIKDYSGLLDTTAFAKMSERFSNHFAPSSRPRLDFLVSSLALMIALNVAAQRQILENATDSLKRENAQRFMTIFLKQNSIDWVPAPLP